MMPTASATPTPQPAFLWAPVQSWIWGWSAARLGYWIHLCLPAIGKVPGPGWALSKYLMSQLNSPRATSGRRLRTQTAGLDLSPCPYWPWLSLRRASGGCQTGALGRVCMVRQWAEGEALVLRPGSHSPRKGSWRQEYPSALLPT